MSDAAKQLLNSALDYEHAFEFTSAKKIYEEIRDNLPGTKEHSFAGQRLEVMDELIREKTVYERIDENARHVLTDIGVNIADHPRLMDIFMEADAVDFESETAVSLPLKRDFIESCLEKMEKHMPGDPGRNSFGTGATPPFLKRPDQEELRPANKEEFERIVRTVSENQDAVKIFSLPVATDKSITGLEVAKCMEDGFKGLKMTASKSFSDDEMTFLKGKDDWVDGTSLITSLSPMGTMVEPFIRSVKSGANLLLLYLTIAGASGPQSPEALLPRSMPRYYS